jgi:SMP-30/Gluconolactonase/LRE-like region
MADGSRRLPTSMAFRPDRWRLLVLSAAAGGLALSGFDLASAQAAKKIEQIDPALDNIISISEPLKKLASGFGGPLGPVEGPVWINEGGYLLFSDIHNSRQMKYTPGQGSAFSWSRQGRVLACEHNTRRVTRRELDGSLSVIASSFLEQWDFIPVVYRISPDLGTLTLLVSDFIIPNGLAFSPDESILYINDLRRGHIRAFDLAPTVRWRNRRTRYSRTCAGPSPACRTA